MDFLFTNSLPFFLSKICETLGAFHLPKMYMEHEFTGRSRVKFSGATKHLKMYLSNLSLITVSGFRGRFSVNGTDLCK